MVVRVVMVVRDRGAGCAAQRCAERQAAALLTELSSQDYSKIRLSSS